MRILYKIPGYRMCHYDIPNIYSHKRALILQESSLSVFAELNSLMFESYIRQLYAY